MLNNKHDSLVEVKFIIESIANNCDLLTNYLCCSCDECSKIQDIKTYIEALYPVLEKKLAIAN